MTVHDEAQHIRMIRDHLCVLVGAMLDQVAGGVGHQVDPIHGRAPEHVLDPFQHGAVQIGFVFEVAVQLRFGDPGLASDVVHADGGAQAVDGAKRGIQQFFPGNLAPVTAPGGDRGGLGRDGCAHVFHASHHQ